MDARGNRHCTLNTVGCTKGALLAAILVALLAVVGLGSQDASAAKALAPCGDVLKRGPVKRDVPGLPPLVIGDSIAGWAVAEINEVGFRTNTQNCRTFGRGLKELAQISKRGKVPKFVILNLGTGGPLKMKQLKRASRLVGEQRKLGLVTPREFKPGYGKRKRKLMKTAARELPNTLLIDWDKASRGHDDWFHWDNLHPVGEGRRALAILFAIAAEHAGVELSPAPG